MNIVIKPPNPSFVKNAREWAGYYEKQAKEDLSLYLKEQNEYEALPWWKRWLPWGCSGIYAAYPYSSSFQQARIYRTIADALTLGHEISVDPDTFQTLCRRPQ